MCHLANSLNMAITSTIGQSIVGWCKLAKHLVASMCQVLEMPF